MHWIYIVLLSAGGAVIGGIGAYFLLAIFTASQSADLDHERWIALCTLARLYHAVENSGGDRSAVDAAMQQAREVLGR